MTGTAGLAPSRPPADQPDQGDGLLSPFRWRIELALLVPVLGLIAVVAVIGGHQEDYRDLAPWGAALLGAGALALPFRHRYPVGVLAVAFATTLAYWSTDQPRGPVWAALVIALVHVVLTGRRAWAIAFLALGWVLVPWLGYAFGTSDRPAVAALLALAAWLITLYTVPEVVRGRRERAREQARSEAEALRRQAADERVRIARDIHDSVAHNMSLISIQAGVALHLLEASRRTAEGSGAGSGGAARGGEDATMAQVHESLATIKDASREALVELRAILGVLRHADPLDAGGGEPGGDVPLAPVPGLDRLGNLLERAAAAGVEVDVDSQVPEATLAQLPRAVDVAVFRIVQESLTNVSRHSGASRAELRFGLRDRILVVEVLDEGTGADRTQDLPGGGNGIAGMRERAAAVGGRLEAGPRPGRGFAVRAELPLPDDRPASGRTASARSAGAEEPAEPAGEGRGRDRGVEAGDGASGSEGVAP